ncbi:MAG: hypothetical protein IJR84_06660 [Bacteroidaceae bacterium]|nr:hypothetical protein [Bacteroidaceae bacterium]MBQ8709956.1 hypothetical protein [Bacteroidaceae bacterium]MBR1492899.1 hypothetical protein [Bacteroidaceae bacterium]
MKKTYIKPTMKSFCLSLQPQFLVVTSVTGEGFNWRSSGIPEEEEDR